MLTLDMTIGQLVAERMSRATLFEKHGIDACCGGQLTLRQACEKRGLDPQVILRELAETDAEVVSDERDWTKATATELVDHLVETHHRFLRETLEPLVPLMNKVLRVHGPSHPELNELSDVYLKFLMEMDQHLNKEENVLFPIIRQIEAGEGEQVAQMRQFVPQPIRVMEMEHDSADRDLTRMSELTNGFVPPEGACGSYQRLLATLAAIEADTRIHMHKENEILFAKLTARV